MCCGTQDVRGPVPRELHDRQGGVDLASVFFDAFSPVGQAGSALQLAAPMVVDPFIQWAENRNFAGNPLRREQHPFGVPKPEYQMGFRSTSAPAKGLAETLNELSGGNAGEYELK
ncbi:LPD38 domain-containing protein [Nitrosospira multiformis]|nr:LPD38 domain-containing protein [Nitrosospira multiformis]